MTWILRRKSIRQCSHDWLTLRLGLGVVFGSWYWRTYPYDYTLPIPLPCPCGNFGLFKVFFFWTKWALKVIQYASKLIFCTYLCKVVKSLIQCMEIVRVISFAEFKKKLGASHVLASLIGRAIEKFDFTALFTNMRTLKFRSCLHYCVFRCRQS